MTNWATIRDYKMQNFVPRASRINLGESYLLLFLRDTRDWTYFFLTCVEFEVSMTFQAISEQNLCYTSRRNTCG